MKQNEMEHEYRPSKLAIVTGVIVIIVAGPLALFDFTYIAISLVSNILSSIDVIEFDKGGFYLLGIAVAMLLLLFEFVWVKLFKNNMPNVLAKYYGKIIIVALILMFTLPHATHYLISNYLGSRGYINCEEAGSQWLHARTIVYVKSSAICQQLVAGENQN